MPFTTKRVIFVDIYCNVTSYLTYVTRDKIIKIFIDIYDF